MLDEPGVWSMKFYLYNTKLKQNRPRARRGSGTHSIKTQLQRLQNADSQSWLDPWEREPKKRGERPCRRAPRNQASLSLSRRFLRTRPTLPLKLGLGSGPAAASSQPVWPTQLQLPATSFVIEH